MTRYTLAQRLVAEALGTATLLATVVGSGIMAEALADGNEALALLCNMLPTAGILVVLIVVFGPISGAHFNPAVTLAFALQRAIVPREAGGFVVAQVLGGIAGVIVAHAMFALPLVQSASTARSTPALWFSEVVATFGLVGVILGAVKVREAAVPAVVGLYVGAAYWFTASTSFANPAVTIARALSDTFTGIRPTDVGGFVVAQLVGAVVAWGLCRWLFQPRG